MGLVELMNSYASHLGGFSDYGLKYTRPTFWAGIVGLPYLGIKN